MELKHLHIFLVNEAKNIIQYALTTKDSIILELKEFDEYYYNRGK